jgi:hypothetical protein
VCSAASRTPNDEAILVNVVWHARRLSLQIAFHLSVISARRKSRRKMRGIRAGLDSTPGSSYPFSQRRVVATHDPSRADAAERSPTAVSRCTSINLNSSLWQVLVRSCDDFENSIETAAYPVRFCSGRRETRCCIRRRRLDQELDEALYAYKVPVADWWRRSGRRFLL